MFLYFVNLSLPLMESKMNKWSILFPAILCLGGCASEVVRYPVELSILRAEERYVTLQTVSVMFNSGYERTIDSGTEFLGIGLIKQGNVLKPVGTVFTIEGAHMHEAYPVINNGRIVGFYLPVEHAFSPLSPSIIFTVEKRKL